MFFYTRPHFYFEYNMLGITYCSWSWATNRLSAMMNEESASLSWSSLYLALAPCLSNGFFPRFLFVHQICLLSSRSVCFTRWSGKIEKMETNTRGTQCRLWIQGHFILPRKAKRQYLLTCKVSIYCLVILKSIVGQCIMCDWYSGDAWFSGLSQEEYVIL